MFLAFQGTSDYFIAVFFCFLSLFSNFLFSKFFWKGWGYGGILARTCSQECMSGRELTSKAHGECSACSNEIFFPFFLSSFLSVADSGVAMAMPDSETSGGRFMSIDHWHKQWSQLDDEDDSDSDADSKISGSFAADSVM